LQGNRPIIVHIFDELVRLLPQGVNFSKITRKSHRLTLEGTAETNKQISDLMRSLADAAWFINPTLDRIAKATHTDLLVKKFKLSVSQNTVKPQAKKVN
jgi:type IV pilus assembly protein PilN